MTSSMLTVNLASGVYVIADWNPADNMAMLWVFRNWTFVWQALKIIKIWDMIAWKPILIRMEAFVTGQNDGVVLTREISFGDNNLGV